MVLSLTYPNPISPMTMIYVTWNDRVSLPITMDREDLFRYAVLECKKMADAKHMPWSDSWAVLFHTAEPNLSHWEAGAR